MENNLAIGSIISGAGLTAYGAYKCIATDERKKGLLLMTAGVTAMAVGAGLLNSNSTPVIDPKAIPCSLEMLKNKLNSLNKTLTPKIFKVLEDTRGISCDNYLPWQSKFGDSFTILHQINLDDLTKPAMWGFKRGGSPFMAIKYICNDTAKGVFTLASGIMSNGELDVGGSFQASGCELNLYATLHRNRPSFFEQLTNLFNNQTVPITNPLYSIVNYNITILN